MNIDVYRVLRNACVISAIKIAFAEGKKPKGNLLVPTLLGGAALFFDGCSRESHNQKLVSAANMALCSSRKRREQSEQPSEGEYLLIDSYVGAQKRCTVQEISSAISKLNHSYWKGEDISIGDIYAELNIKTPGLICEQLILSSGFTIPREPLLDVLYDEKNKTALLLYAPEVVQLWD